MDGWSITFTMSSTTQAYELVLRIRHVDRKFRRARKQIIVLNNRLEGLLVHYQRAGRDSKRQHRYARRLQVATYEGVRNMFYEYARQQCEAMEELQTELKDITGEEYDDFEEYSS